MLWDPVYFWKWLLLSDFYKLIMIHYTFCYMPTTLKFVLRSFKYSTSAWCVRLTTLPPSWAVVMKSGNLNFLESSGSVQACNGTTLPLHSMEHTKNLYNISSLHITVDQYILNKTMPVSTKCRKCQKGIILKPAAAEPYHKRVRFF